MTVIELFAVITLTIVLTILFAGVLTSNHEMVWVGILMMVAYVIIIAVFQFGAYWQRDDYSEKFILTPKPNATTNTSFNR